MAQKHVLIASLGESPVVVTAMYDLLTEQEKLHIDKVVVLHPEDEGTLIPLGFDLIKDALKGRCEIQQVPLPFEDVNGEGESYTFLRIFYGLLAEAEKDGDTVYISLAGGRKNMSALMAILVPLFSCVKGLYHIIDRDEDSRQYHFLSFEELAENLIYASEEDCQSYFFPDRNRLRLVPISYGKRQQVSEAFRSRLYTIAHEEDLEDLFKIAPDEAEAVEFVQDITSTQEPERMLEVLLTGHAAEQFRDMWKYDRKHAKGFKLCFDRMRFATKARRGAHDIYSRKLHKGEHDIYSQNLPALTFHFFKIKRKHHTSVERPVFHTVPKDIKSCSNEEVESVIVSELEFKQSGRYRSLEEITNARGFFPLGSFIHLDELLTEMSISTTEINDTETDENIDSVLIVPLGATPMIATQLYTLLRAQGHIIREVILVYPEDSLEIQNGVDLLQKAFREEGVVCMSVKVRGYADIDSKEACLAYEKVLEEAIDDARRRHSSDVQVDLALAGGRKGMAALAMFVAQRKGIRHVYHTLINDKKLSDKVEQETTVSELLPNKVDGKLRNDRLFLRAYEGEGPYTKFVLFKVPVLPTGS